MKALLLAAGEGKRMHPLTKEVPKPMLRLRGKPLLQHIIESLPVEVTELIVVVGYKQEAIRSYFGTEFQGRPIRYLVQESYTGTADALELCRPYLAEGERFVLTYGDDIYDTESIARCLTHQYAFLVGEVEDPRRYGVILLNQDGTIAEIEEKPEHPKSNLVAPGLYVLDTKIFDCRPHSEWPHEYYLMAMLNQFVTEQKVYGEKTGRWLTFAYPKDLEAAEMLLAREA